jgi:hypothetical protein
VLKGGEKVHSVGKVSKETRYERRVNPNSLTPKEDDRTPPDRHTPKILYIYIYIYIHPSQIISKCEITLLNVVVGSVLGFCMRRGWGF